MRKIITIMLSIILVFAISITAYGSTIRYKDENGKTQIISDFKDTQSHWAHDVILKWADYNIVSGNNGNFMPNQPIKRGDFCLIINRLLNLSTKSYNFFYDLPNDAYYTDAVLKCVAAGYVSGTSSTTVSPNGNATREQIAVILFRMLKLDSTGYQNVRKFSDDYNIGSWAREAVYTMRKYGYMNGDGNNNFNPRANITRAEIMQVLNNVSGSYFPTSDLTNEGNTFKSDFSSNVLAARFVSLVSSHINGDLIITPNNSQVNLSSTIVDNRIFVMGATTISLKDSGCNSLYLNEGKAKVVGISSLVKSVYVANGASESQIDAVPNELILEPGTRIVINGKFYENETQVNKIYYGKDINEDIADVQGYVVGGPKIIGYNEIQRVNNDIEISNLNIAVGYADVAEVGVVWNKVKQNAESINPTYSKCDGKMKYTGILSGMLSFKAGCVEGERIYRIYVKDSNGLLAYSKAFTHKEYNWNVDMKIYKGSNYPRYTTVDVIFSGDNVPNIYNVYLFSGKDEKYDTTRKQHGTVIYNDSKAEYKIDKTKYIRYYSEIESPIEYDETIKDRAFIPDTYWGYTITYSDGTIINEYPVLSNVLPEGVSPFSELITGNATFMNSKICVSDNIITTKYVVPQEFGVIYKTSNTQLFEEPSANTNGWVCKSNQEYIGVNESNRYSINVDYDTAPTYFYYAAYAKTSYGYWYGDVSCISKDFLGDENGYSLTSANMQYIGDTDVLLQIKYSGKDISTSDYISLNNSIGLKTIKDYSGVIDTDSKTIYFLLNNVDSANQSTYYIQIYNQNYEKSNMLATILSKSNIIPMSLIDKKDEKDYYSYRISASGVNSITLQDASIVGSDSKTIVSNGRLYIPKGVSLSTNMTNVTMYVKMTNYIGFVVHRTLSLY